MVNVHSKALDEVIEVDRIIGHVAGKQKGATLIFVGGIHGNEPAGVFALKKVLADLDPSVVRGDIYALAGNLSALEKGVRYHETDLNRLWTTEQLNDIRDGTEEILVQDQKEQLALLLLLKQIMNVNNGPFYFFDIHTTSSETLPFLTINDSLLNRNFTAQYPLPIILGIEEYLDGPLLSFVNELGYVAFGFEAGQHDTMTSIETSIAFIYLSLVFTGCITAAVIDFQRYRDTLAKSAGDETYIYEIVSRYVIKKDDHFKMEPGFLNFQRVQKNQVLAYVNGKPHTAQSNARVFMPLYQNQGSDGYFTIQKVWKPFLRLSAMIRKYRLDRILVWLPGVRWTDKHRSGILVNKRVARFFTKEVFHLFGYRSIKVQENHYRMYNRESRAQNAMYLTADWNV